MLFDDELAEAPYFGSFEQQLYVSNVIAWTISSRPDGTLKQCHYLSLLPL